MSSSYRRYNLSVTVLVVMVVVLTDGVTTKMTARLVSGPENTVTKEGDTAVMSCTIDSSGMMTGGTSLKWYRVSNNAFTAISQDDRIKPNTRPAMGSYEITGNHQEGDYSLRITRVDRQDSGMYHCGFELGPSRNITSLGAELLVVVPPSITSPSCVMMTASDTPSRSFSTSPPPVFSVGDTARLMCYTSGGIPPASLVWKRLGTRLTGLTTHSNVIDIVIEESDLDVNFTCYATSPALDAPRSCSLVPARRPHVVRIMPERPVVSLRGGITLSCEAEDISPDVDAVWQWFFKGNKVPSENDLRRRFSASNDNKSLTIGLVVAADHDAEIVCQLTTANERTGRATTYLQVEGVRRPIAEVNTSATDFSSVSYDTTTDMGIPPDTAPTVKMHLIIASSIAGVAIAALAIILIAFICRRHAKTKRRNANLNNNPDPNPTPTRDVRPKQMIQVKTPANRNRERITTPARLPSEDCDYTALRRANGSTSEYQSICRKPPTAPRLDLAAATSDNDMCWEYEIPYTVDTLNHVKPVPMNITNPDYLEIM